jgi:hypothetical protein
MADPKFRLLKARSAAGRMDELGRFLEFWFGPRRAKYGEPEKRLARLPLPDPLRRFYAFAGRWPSPDPGGMDRFYTGSSGHHLRPVGDVELREDGKLDFFMEYQGDWVGLTLPDADDPPVWLSGWLEEGDDDERTVRVTPSLSKFLVTHCLMTIVYEMENAVTVAQEQGPLVDYFNSFFEEPWGRSFAPARIWDTRGLKWPRSCLDYEGSFYLFAGSILVHRTATDYHFAALRLGGIRTLVDRLEER